MAIKIDVTLDCEKLREQLREVIREVIEDAVHNGPHNSSVSNNINVSPPSPNSQQIAQDIARLIHGSPA